MKAKIKAGDILNFPARDLSKLRSGPALFTFLTMLITIMAASGSIGPAAAASVIQDFETGKVAERDVTADYPVSYIDEEGTRLRIEAQQKLVPAVFRISAAATAEIRDSWRRFSDLADRLAEAGGSAEARRLAVQAEYPALFPDPEVMDAYFSASERINFRDYGFTVLDNILEKGIFALNLTELQNYNPDIADLVRAAGQERVFYSDVYTLDDTAGLINQIAGGEMPESFRAMAEPLLKPFIKENVFFSSADTRRRVMEVREHVEPVMKNISKDKRIIRKGFVITEDEMRELRAFHLSRSRRDPRIVIGTVLLVLFFYGLFIFLRSKLFLGRELRDRESYLLSALVCLYIVGSVMLKNFFPLLESFRAALVFPAALLVMIPAVFMGPRLSLALAIALPLGAYLCGSFDTFAYFFALVSGLAASVVIRKAEKRMDLIKAGLVIAAANCAAVIVILLLQRAGPGAYPAPLFWAALNGIVSGMLVLGFLPPLEQALNAATTFRLMELSDLNAPILRRLFTMAPGTYSHSILVANLAEQACQDIGANALLAQVGAYYHDLGKTENPDYFVENQTDYNRHDDIAPRLSATVIRSHVKLGVEKARGLNLPQEVIDIIAEHHGNSLITWFYNKASQQEAQVNSDDFTYPGVPPRSRESAVVMLADVSEAAVRTLSKPTAAKIERFIQQLFDDKVKHGQLADSELSFRDLETIKNAFVKVLAGYYHSRIEYPKQVSDENGDRPESEEAE
jgi:putative nucleotidyltransferase with HDIG domain